MRRDAAHAATFLITLILSALILSACSRGDTDSEQASADDTASTNDPLAGSCLQVEVTFKDGFHVDGQPTPEDQLASSLDRALESGNRTAIVDVKCGENVTVAAIRALHDAMREREIYRIQYFRDPQPPIPLVLPSPQMDAQVAGLPPESKRSVEVDASGGVSVDGRQIDRSMLRQDVAAILEATPEVIIVFGAEDVAKYRDFVDVLGEVTAAGAERIAITI